MCGTENEGGGDADSTLSNVVTPVPDQTRRSADRELEVRMLKRTEALALEKQDLESELVCWQAAEEHMRVSRAQLAEAARHLISTQELERIWVARQLRDLVIQTLGAVKYQLEAGGRAAPSAITRLQEVMGDIDAIATSIRPSILDDFGAVSAIRWLCREFAKSHSTLRVSETISVRDDAIPKRLQTALFRIAQELLSNVATRSQACHVTVCLSQISAQLFLEVLADGFESRQAGGEGASVSDQGNFAVRMHAELSGGHFCFLAGDGGTGARARVQWPLGVGEF